VTALDDIGGPDFPMNVNPITVWQAAVRDKLNTLENELSATQATRGNLVPSYIAGALTPFGGGSVEPSGGPNGERHHRIGASGDSIIDLTGGADPFPCNAEAAVTTHHFMAKADNEIMFRPYLNWYDKDGVTITNHYPGPQAIGSEWKLHSHTAIAPSNAAFFRPFVYFSRAGDSATVDLARIGAWVGAGGSWSMPGAPIMDLGRRITRPNIDDRLVEVWNGTGWSVVDYHSGWRNLVGSGLITNLGTATVSNARLLRTTHHMTLDFDWVGSVNRVNIDIPVGFRPATTYQYNVYGVINNYPPGEDGWWETVGGGVAFQVIQDGNGAVSINLPAQSVIPTSLPGSLISPAPQ
jgi:hypothetical protein